MAKVAPSILSADFSKLGADVQEICEFGADYIHVDVMDGAFVPNISFGAGVMKSLNNVATIPYDVHLMIEDPDRYIEDFVTPNTEFITVHQEACRHLDRTIQHIHSTGVKAGVALNPATPIVMVEDVLDKVDMILIMSVNPGFGGQKFIPRALDKIRRLDEIRKTNGYDFVIEVDGGVNLQNCEELKSVGTDILVAGSAVFKAEDRKEAIAVLGK
ncbi:ribulose-phosphate 3-epimerase [Mogibacterium kristiansenii]|uniref:ribulose-phosphate 3-epimerase n=1 Tax=Mogibacterium kristiansenii TaxID=2606708 RepID=UPI00240A9B15|nr:ribulose-phosphate 3-epimerase [Mogibacterium kristiansenii]MDD6699520.1 ribulose-phosphate 3-epimerase [Mogibacterium kristiansenii]